VREDDLVRLKAMHDAAKRALTFANGKSRADLETDLSLVLFTKKALEIISTAATKTTRECKKHYTDFPWGPVSELGKRINKRDFAEDDLNRMWHIVSEELPRLAALLEAILVQENDGHRKPGGG
jgi:uncharacterized protein with HEPN domain